MRLVFACVLIAFLPSSTQDQARPFEVAPPAGLPELVAPKDNPMTPASYALGRRLFFDKRLSKDSTVSCATCHDPKHGFASPDVRSKGVDGNLAQRHTPMILNRGFGKLHSWDGRASTLEAQMLLPISNPLEMGLELADAVKRLRADESYVAEFQRVYGGAPSQDTLGKALASFVRNLTIGDSPVDRFQKGEREALNVDERAGQWVFESKGGCWKCHTPPLYSDEDFHNTGVGADQKERDVGRYAITKRSEDRGRFKTPTLRALTMTAPYMHDGSIATLEEVVAFYNRGGNKNSNLSPKIKPLGLTDEEARRLVVFLKALSRRAKGK